MSGAMKKVTTGLTGLHVMENPHKALLVVYDKIIRTLQKMPEDASYRRHTENIVNERIAAVNTTHDVPSLEHKVNCGQAEELIKQAEHELILARKMVDFKAWEPLIQEAPKNQWKWPI